MDENNTGGTPFVVFNQTMNRWCQQMTDDGGNPSAKEEEEKGKTEADRTSGTKMQLEPLLFPPFARWLAGGCLSTSGPCFQVCLE